MTQDKFAARRLEPGLSDLMFTEMVRKEDWRLQNLATKLFWKGRRIINVRMLRASVTRKYLLVAGNNAGKGIFEKKKGLDFCI